MTGMTPTFDVDVSTAAERAALAAVLVHAPKAWPVVSVLKPDDFADLKCRATLQAMHELAKSGHPIDGMTVASKLRSMGAFTKMDGADLSPTHYARHVDELSYEFVTIDNLDYYVGKVAEAARGRELQTIVAKSAKLSPDAAATSLAKALEQYQSSASRNTGFETLTVGDVPEFGPTRWLIEGLWVAGGCGFIAGEPKARKSFFTAAAAVAVATGRKVLQRFQAMHGPVLMFNAEDRIQETARRLRRIAVAEGLDPRLPNIHIINVTGMRLSNAADVAKLRATVARIKPVFTVLDPFRNLYEGEENDSGAVMSALQPLRAIERDYGTAVAVVHHMTKQNENGPKRRAGQRMRGSGALHGWGDSNLYVELAADQSISVVEIEQRYAEAGDDFAWQLRDQNTPDGEAVWCEPVAVPGKKSDEETKQSKTAALEALILRTLHVSKVPMHAGELSKSLHMRRQNVFEALSVLSSEGSIEQVERDITDKAGRTRAISGWVIKGAAHAV